MKIPQIKASASTPTGIPALATPDEGKEPAAADAAKRQEMVEETGVEPVSRNLRPVRLQACPVNLSLGPSPTHRQERSTSPTRFDLAAGPPGEVPLASPYSRRPYPALQAPQESRSRVLSRESVIGVGDYNFSQFFYEVPRKPRPAALTSTIPVETVSPPDRARSLNTGAI
jgi:hypothetical protein